MAERRMFTKKVTESDAFLDMPKSTQALYFHLNMSADDDGFLNNPKKIQRMVGASDDDMKLLIAKSFIIVFDSGIIVIKHWKMHNYIQSDRYKPTDYIEEKSMLQIKKNKVYTLVSESDTECIQNVSVGKVRLGKVRLGKDNIYIPYSEIVDYLNLKANTKYRSTSSKTQTLIKARLNEGFTLQDFYTVIDKKVAVWINDPMMNQYLRPETLFGTKFEGYLNEKGGKNGSNSGNNQENQSGVYDTSKIEYQGPGTTDEQDPDF
ncbi:conserved phage C-terminal domain-containing protein [Ruminiclostridium papyrosolvens]|uniref:DNA replication protein n=1 Tax=Ruminiclostridium papyrosolvens C7 TaxID=1330534 RepID=U4QYU3_9FIRM|nr:conserved phage C-terminal domain-containing protein [Ruminiclostridium papyrosolvens]EPR10120.1 DNA replication protein [Ruminiclostridium papyrosolvens C7]